jgi:hypothetical protein
MRAGVPQSFQIAHAVAVIETFTFRLIFVLSFHGVFRDAKQKRLDSLQIEALALIPFRGMNAKSSLSPRWTSLLKRRQGAPLWQMQFTLR